MKFTLHNNLQLKLITLICVSTKNCQNWYWNYTELILFKNDLWVFLTKITVKLILNVAYHGWETKKIFHSTLPKTALHGIFLLFYLTEKLNCIKELCQKSFSNILNYIMRNSTYTQEKIISTSVKTLQITALPLSAAL